MTGVQTCALPICLFSETFLIENQQAATDSRTGACLYVDSKDDGAFIKVTGCNENNDKQNWAYTLKGQIEVSVWSHIFLDYIQNRCVKKYSLLFTPIWFHSSGRIAV